MFTPPLSVHLDAPLERWQPSRLISSVSVRAKGAPRGGVPAVGGANTTAARRRRPTPLQGALNVVSKNTRCVTGPGEGRGRRVGADHDGG